MPQACAARLGTSLTAAVMPLGQRYPSTVIRRSCRRSSSRDPLAMVSYSIGIVYGMQMCQLTINVVEVTPQAATVGIECLIHGTGARNWTMFLICLTSIRQMVLNVGPRVFPASRRMAMMHMKRAAVSYLSGSANQAVAVVLAVAIESRGQRQHHFYCQGRCCPHYMSCGVQPAHMG